MAMAKSNVPVVTFENMPVKAEIKVTLKDGSVLERAYLLDPHDLGALTYSEQRTVSPIYGDLCYPVDFWTSPASTFQLKLRGIPWLQPDPKIANRAVYDVPQRGW